MYCSNYLFPWTWVSSVNWPDRVAHRANLFDWAARINAWVQASFDNIEYVFHSSWYNSSLDANLTLKRKRLTGLCWSKGHYCPALTLNEGLHNRFNSCCVEFLLGLKLTENAVEFKNLIVESIELAWRSKLKSIIFATYKKC